jgi:LysM repeat protein
MLTISAVVLLHLGVIAVLVGVNGCRTTTGFERTADLGAFSGASGTASGAAPAASAPSPVGGVGLNEGPAPVEADPRPVVQPAGPGGTHVVAKGESLFVIARREGVTVAQLAAANGLELNAVLRIGQKLSIPARDAAATPRTGASGAAPVPAAPAPSVIPQGGFGGFTGYSADAPAPAQPAPDGPGTR